MTLNTRVTRHDKMTKHEPSMLGLVGHRPRLDGLWGDRGDRRRPGCIPPRRSSSQEKLEQGGAKNNPEPFPAADLANKKRKFNLPPKTDFNMSGANAKGLGPEQRSFAHSKFPPQLICSFLHYLLSEDPSASPKHRSI